MSVDINLRSQDTLKRCHAGREGDVQRKRVQLLSESCVEQHRLGIKPSGHAYSHRTASLGRFFHAWSSELLLSLLANHLDWKSLHRLGTSSRAWYAWSHFDEIWKSWTLRDWAQDEARAERFCGSWRETYLFQKGLVKTSPSKTTYAINTDFACDLLFHTHLYTVTPLRVIERRTLDRHKTVPRISKVSRELFEAEYHKRSRPVIVQGLLDEWKARKLWTNWDWWIDNFGDHVFQVESVKIRFRVFLEYMLSEVRDEAPIYLFDKDIPEDLEGDFDVPEMFGEDLFSLLGTALRPDYRWLIIGPSRSGSTFHKDPNATSAWNSVVRGRKLWVLVPPTQTPAGVFPYSDFSVVTTPASIVDWFVNFGPQCTGGYAAVCEAGETMFVPSGWWHCVLNLEPSIAVTQNFVSRSNLRSSLKFIRDQPQNVSGLGTSGDPQRLHDEFVRLLQQHDQEEVRKIAQGHVSKFSARPDRAQGSAGDDDSEGRKKKDSREFAFGFV